MSETNQRNILYFEASSMRQLYEDMEQWQEENKKRFLSTDILPDKDKFCCIALTNPMEVVITDKTGSFHAHVDHRSLHVYS